MARTWTNGGGTPLSAANLNALETDLTAALGVPEQALIARLLAGDTKATLDAAYRRRVPVEIPAAVDLNAYITDGVFAQSQSNDAVSGTNYPLATAGLLVVETFGNFVFQEYTGYQVANRRFWRAKYNTNWSAWQEVSPVGHTHAVATSSVAGFMSAADKTKMDIPYSATTTNSSVATRDATGNLRANSFFGDAAQSTAVNAMTRKDYVDALGALKVNIGSLSRSLEQSTATMNGTADDTAAVQSFLDAVPAGSTVIMPVGKTVKLTNVLTISKPMTITGWDMTLGTNNKAFAITSSDVTIHRNVIRGVGIGAGYVQGNRAIIATGTSAAPLDNINITMNEITGINDACIYLTWVTNSKANFNYCQNYVYTGITVSSGVDVDIMFNTVRDATQGSTGNSYGIVATDIVNVESGRSRRVKIHHNTVMNVPDWEGIDTHGGAYISIIGNTVVGCRRAIQCLVGNDGVPDSRMLAPQYIVATGNTVDGAGANGATTGITLYGKIDGSMLAHGIVSGNAIYNCTTPTQLGYFDSTKTLVRNNVGEDYDTGWQALTGFFTGWASNSTYPARYRVVRVGQLTTVHLEGMLSRTTGTSNLITLPTLAQPGYAKIVGPCATTSPTQLGTLEITPAGVLRVIFTDATTGNLTIAATYSF